MNRPTERLSRPGAPAVGSPSALASRWLGRVVGIVVGTAIAIGALFVSVIAFAVVVMVAAIVGAWLWWRTRDLRRQFRTEMERMQQQVGGAAGSAGSRRGFDADGAAMRGRRGPAQGDVLDGDFIREAPEPSQRPGTDAPR